MIGAVGHDQELAAKRRHFQVWKRSMLSSSLECNHLHPACIKWVKTVIQLLLINVISKVYGNQDFDVALVVLD